MNSKPSVPTHSSSLCILLFIYNDCLQFLLLVILLKQNQGYHQEDTISRMKSRLLFLLEIQNKWLERRLKHLELFIYLMTKFGFEFFLIIQDSSDINIEEDPIPNMISIYITCPETNIEFFETALLVCIFILVIYYLQKTKRASDIEIDLPLDWNSQRITSFVSWATKLGQ